MLAPCRPSRKRAHDMETGPRVMSCCGRVTMTCFLSSSRKAQAEMGSAALPASAAADRDGCVVPEVMSSACVLRRGRRVRGNVCFAPRLKVRTGSHSRYEPCKRNGRQRLVGARPPRADVGRRSTVNGRRIVPFFTLPALTVKLLRKKHSQLQDLRSIFQRGLVKVRQGRGVLSG